MRQWTAMNASPARLWSIAEVQAKTGGARGHVRGQRTTNNEQRTANSSSSGKSVTFIRITYPFLTHTFNNQIWSLIQPITLIIKNLQRTSRLWVSECEGKIRSSSGGSAKPGGTRTCAISSYARRVWCRVRITGKARITFPCLGNTTLLLFSSWIKLCHQLCSARPSFLI